MTKPHTTLSEAVRALETIERGEIEVFDDDLGENVLAPMSAEEMQEVARTALAATQAGDAVSDTEMLDFIEAHPEMLLRKHKKYWQFVGFTNYEYDVFKTPREAIRAAMSPTTTRSK